MSADAGPSKAPQSALAAARLQVSGSRGADREEADTCRICRGEGTDQEPLFYPCKCSGSIKYVHQDCLMEWLSHTQKKHCELCKTSFRFTKLYHPGMPSQIPTIVFVRRAALHVLNMLVAWCRAVLVAAVWLLWLPWCMRVVWRSLFWLGDGGWSQDVFVLTAETSQSQGPPHELQHVHSAVQVVKDIDATHNLPFSRFIRSIPYAPLNTTSFFSIVSQRLLLGFRYPFIQMAQIAHAVPPSTIKSNFTSSNSTSDALGNRSPSLLSDVSFFNRFQSQTLNRFTIDVLEGQIITLFVVVAFILIFLIREWVVQQQPVMNLVAMGNQGRVQRENVDQPDDFAADDAGAEDDVLVDPEGVDENDHENTAPQPTVHPGRRSSSLQRRSDEIDLKVDPENFTEPVEDILLPGLHKDLDDMLSGVDIEESSHKRSLETRPPIDAIENRTNPFIVEIGQPTETHEESKPATTTTSTTTTTSRRAYSAREDNILNPLDPASSDADVDSSELTRRPNMPSRDRSFIATEIRRSLEEGQVWPSAQSPNVSTKVVQEGKLTLSSRENDDQLWRTGQEQGPTSNGATESEHSNDSWQQVPNVIVEDDPNQVLEGVPLQDKGKAKVININTTDVADYTQENSFGINDSASIISEKEEDVFSLASERGSDLYSEPSKVDENSQSANENSTSIGSVPPIEAVQAPHDSFNLILDWMFGDIAATTPTVEEAEIDEQVVRNAPEQPPFPPFVNNERRENDLPRIQDPEVAAAAAQAGIDVNDQDAIDDAEDLEGILELIGMQGPLIGLFQNVLFSEVLISATLACAVWLPYLWGKVVILFLGSPVSLFIKLPLQLVASTTDLFVDITLFVIAGSTYWASQLITLLVRLCSFGRLSLAAQSPFSTISAPAKSLAESSLDRIGRLLIESPLSPRPDYFRLSVNSHTALRRLQNSTFFALNETGSFANSVIEKASGNSLPRLMLNIIKYTPIFARTSLASLGSECSALFKWLWTSKSYKITFNFDIDQNSTIAYTTTEYWTATDRMVAIFAGYAFFALAGAVYLKRSTPFSTSQEGQKIERMISDVLQQAGGVLKVILIISIEMLAFPLYCGLLLDVATLPFFQDVTLLTRWHFIMENPWTSGFMHWFVGTCYMFHFALFVSMCRKIMRKGVLYFIKDPDDPTFHPVRDVLERSVATQLRKIAFSALVYGALVMLCLGGVVWSLSKATSGVLPIHWATEASPMEFPLDLLFYNFLTPIVIKFYKPNDTLHAIYRWWFRTSAGFLRLSSFLFGDEAKEQEGSDGIYVRAPASDQARIPKGQPVFVEVDADNIRKDGQTDDGIHNSDLVAMVYIPPWFRIRIFAFVVAIWIFMAVSGLSITILPLLLGRYLFSLFLPPTIKMNDIHAFSLGIYVFGSFVYSGFQIHKLIVSLMRPFPDPLSTFSTAVVTSSRASLQILRFLYVWGGLVFAIPILFAVLIELYLLMPLHAYLSPTEPHVVHVIQDWTLGFLYSRLVARFMLANQESRPARAFQAVIRDGYLYPNAVIATRCFIIPALAAFLLAIALPASLALLASKTMYWGASEATQNLVWRFSFPAVGASLFVTWTSKELVRLLIRWRLVIRDEVYLVGERLHNFGERKAPVVAEKTRKPLEQARDTSEVRGKVMQGQTERARTL